MPTYLSVSGLKQTCKNEDAILEETLTISGPTELDITATI